MVCIVWTSVNIFYRILILWYLFYKLIKIKKWVILKRSIAWVIIAYSSYILNTIITSYILILTLFNTIVIFFYNINLYNTCIAKSYWICTIILVVTDELFLFLERTVHSNDLSRSRPRPGSFNTGMYYNLLRFSCFVIIKVMKVWNFLIFFYLGEPLLPRIKPPPRRNTTVIPKSCTNDSIKDLCILDSPPNDDLMKNSEPFSFLDG